MKIKKTVNDLYLLRRKKTTLWSLAQSMPEATPKEPIYRICFWWVVPSHCQGLMKPHWKTIFFTEKKTPLPQNEPDKARQLSDEVTTTEELHQREKCIKQRTFEYITGNHRKLQVWALPFSRYMLFTSFHRIILCADLEGTHQDHWVPTPSPAQHTPRIPPCAREGCPNTPWPLSGLALWPLPWGTCSSTEPFSGWWTFSQYPT